MRRGILAVMAVALAACATAKDSIGGDERLDEGDAKEAAAEEKKDASCGPDGKGDLALLDGRTGGPVACTAVSITAEQMSCAMGSDCTADLIFEGTTNKRGLALARHGFSGVRLVAVADGYATSYLPGAEWAADKVVELELMPAEGYWLKVLDAEGNYLPDVTITFKRGEELVAQLKSNELANVFFPQRQPFAGEPVTVSADGYVEFTVASSEDLGEDGHTLTLRK